MGDPMKAELRTYLQEGREALLWKLDGLAGLTEGNDNLPARDASWWGTYRARVEQAARDAAGLTPPG